MQNYHKPIDAALFPDGCERCSFSQFSLWMGALGVVFLWGVYAAFITLANGLGVTGLDDYFGFGLWITFDLAVIALGAGAFFTSLLRYILNIDSLKNIVNLAVIIGFLCYSGAMLVLVLDIGQPIRAWFGYWYPNVHSMLTEVIFCITCYCIVLVIEYTPITLENRMLMKNRTIAALAHNFHVFMPLFAGIGAFLSTFHQGSLGGMYGVLFGRPYVYREGFFIWPWTFFLYILSAVSVGPMFTTLVASLMEKLTGKKLVSYDVKQLMAKIAGTMLLIYAVFKCLDTLAWINGILPKAGLSYSDQFYGTIYGQWMFILEHLFAIVPAILLLMPSIRQNMKFYYTLFIIACIGVTINRYVMTVQALAIPVMPFDDWKFYAPNWVEWAACALVVSYGAMILSLTYRYCPVFPQEVELNK